MPHIKIYGSDKAKVKALSADLAEELAQAIGCPSDWIYFSCQGDGKLFSSGKTLKNTVFIEIEWFDRGLEVKNKIVDIMSQEIFQSKGRFSKIDTINFVFVTTSEGDFYARKKPQT